MRHVASGVRGIWQLNTQHRSVDTLAAREGDIEIGSGRKRNTARGDRRGMPVEMRLAPGNHRIEGPASLL